MGYVLPDDNSNLLLSFIFDISAIFNDRASILPALEKEPSGDMTGWG